MIGKTRGQFGFADLEVEQAVGRQGFLERVNRLIDWAPFEQRLAGVFKDSPRGRPSYPVLVHFKVLLLAQWYGLSDPMAEEALADRLSFRSFVGLSLQDRTLDETTICRFRNRLAELGLMGELLAELDRQLCAKGLVVKRGTLVDASLVKAQSRPVNKSAPKQPKDREAAWTVKRGQGLYGYKFHAGVDLDTSLIRRATLTPANVPEGRCFDELLPEDEAAVFADCAYSTKARRKALRARGVYPGILAKGYYRKKLSPGERRRNARLRPIRSGVERVFGTLKRSYALERARYLGLARNLNHALLQAFAYNLKKTVALAGAA
ncbi:MAG: IS5 family transposase [Gammaproteobacteria bacterium]|nr:IS5 family transposase [Gammaproteobacteria bacterium]